MHLGSIYLIVRDFDKSISFYEKLLEMKVTSRNMDRFAQFMFEGHNISLMNGYFDTNNPDKVVYKGDYSNEFDDMATMADSKNSNKFVLNFWIENLEQEHERIKNAGLSSSLTEIKYICNVSPYYYFQLKDPDDNIIEVTGDFTPYDGQFK